MTVELNYSRKLEREPRMARGQGQRMAEQGWSTRGSGHWGTSMEGNQGWRNYTLFSDAIQSTFIYVMSLILQLRDMFFLLDSCGNSSEMICLWSLSNKKTNKELTRLGEILFKRIIVKQRKGLVQWGE